MPKRSNDFQRMIAFIETHVAGHGFTVVESAFLKEPDGTNREVDVLIHGRVGEHEVTIALECRDHGRKADVKWIDELIGKYRNLPVNKIVAVARNGFTTSAVLKAQNHNIDTKLVSQVYEIDWESEGSLPFVALIDREDRLVELSIILSAVSEPPLNKEELESSWVLSPAGLPIGRVRDWMQDHWDRKERIEFKVCVDNKVVDIADTFSNAIVKGSKIVKFPGMRIRGEQGAIFLVEAVEFKAESSFAWTFGSTNHFRYGKTPITIGKLSSQGTTLEVTAIRHRTDVVDQVHMSVVQKDENGRVVEPDSEGAVTWRTIDAAVRSNVEATSGNGT